MNLDKPKHTQHFLRCLRVLPRQFTPFDSHRLSIVYFCIIGLDVLGSLDSIEPSLRQQWVDWIYTCQVSTGGFKNAPGSASEYNPAHVAATYFALASLITLGDNHVRVHRHETLRWIQSLQLQEGNFAATLVKGIPQGERDLRFSYCACAAAHLLNAPPSTIDYARLSTFISSCVSYNGLVGQRAAAEGHAGLTYCALAIYSLSNGSMKSPTCNDDFLGALLQLQCEGGGFSGRVNKNADSCYSYWVMASLSLLQAECSSSTSNVEFLLGEVQHQFGGFSKTKGDHPDPLHSCLSLLSLSLSQFPHLEAVHPALAVTKRSVRNLAFLS